MPKSAGLGGRTPAAAPAVASAAAPGPFSVAPPAAVAASSAPALPICQGCSSISQGGAIALKNVILAILIAIADCNRRLQSRLLTLATGDFSNRDCNRRSLKKWGEMSLFLPFAE